MTTTIPGGEDQTSAVKYVCRKCKWSSKSTKQVIKCGNCGGKYVVAT